MFRRLFTFVMIFLSFSLSSAYSADGFMHRIILLGNSITVGKGSSDGLGFRDELYYRLKNTGFPFEFVGSAGINPFKGHYKSGAVIGDFYAGIGGNASFNVGPDMSSFKPTIAVIHLGTNDFWLGGEVIPYSYDGGLTFSRSVSGRLGHLIEFLLNWHNGVKGRDLQTIFVCKIIPKKNKHVLQIAEFNEAVEQIVEAANRGELATIPPGILKLVDQYSTFDVNTMLSLDGTHPNGKGYLHMTDIFFDAFMSLPLYLNPEGRQEFEEYAGRFVQDTIMVRVTDGFGKGVENVPVNFRIKQGDAVLAGSSTVYTDTSGIAFMDSVIMGSADSSVIVASSPGLIDSTVTFCLKQRSYREITGRVVYFSSGVPVNGVIMHSEESIEKHILSDDEGRYLVSVPMETTKVEIIPYKDDADIEVSAFDAALTARYALGVDTLGFIAKLAADVDGDSVVTINDALTILNHVVGIDTTSSLIGRWVFNPPSLQFDSLMSDTTAEVIYAAVKGDVHGGWNSSTASDLYTVSLGFSDVISQEKGLYTIPLYINGTGLMSSKFTLEFDPSYSEIIAVSPLIQSLTFRSNISKAVGEAVIAFCLKDVENYFNNTPVVNIKIRTEDIKSLNIKIGDAFVNGVRANIINNYTTVAQENYNNNRNPSFERVYPNPFNSSCAVRFKLPYQDFASIKVYDVLGREIVVLFDGLASEGNNVLIWDGKNRLGADVVSGTYFIRFSTDEKTAVQRVQLIR